MTKKAVSDRVADNLQDALGVVEAFLEYQIADFDGPGEDLAQRRAYETWDLIRGIREWADGEYRDVPEMRDALEAVFVRQGLQGRMLRRVS